MKNKSTYSKQQERQRRFRFTLLFIGITLLLVLVALLLARCGVKEKIPASSGAVVSTAGLEIPAVTDPEFLIVCEEGRYTLWYDTLYRQAAWTAHTLTASDVENDNAQRKNNFTVCHVARSKGWPYASSDDYTNTGYDRGHLVPSADRVTSQPENDATFRLSNVAPQSPRLNRVLWNNLEATLRRLTQRFDTLWIVTGSELKPGLPRIGRNGVGVPEYFFKAILAQEGDKYRAIAFVVPNREEIDGTFWAYAVSVDEAERLSGIDFFPGLPDVLETRIESECFPEEWK